jgi:hypothetical protein
MTSRWFRWIVMAAAGLTLAGSSYAADDSVQPIEAKKPKVVPHGFFSRYVAPQMDARLTGETQAAVFLTNPAANPWTRDDGTVARVGRTALRATKGAMKRYAIESLGINAWSVPLFGGTGTGMDALRTDSGGARLRFGFSHLAPRAEVLLPVDAGHVSLSADALGRVGATFETPSTNFRVGASVDPRGHDGTFTFSCRF